MEINNANDLGLSKILETMTKNNDYVIVLKVLQTLSAVRRAGYIGTKELVGYLSFCCDAFAINDNYEFFDEFVECMPDITSYDNSNPFSIRSRCHYFAAKNSNDILNNLKDICTDLTVDELKTWFRDYIVNKVIYTQDHIRPLLDQLMEKSYLILNSIHLN